MANIFVSYEKSDQADYLTVVNSYDSKKKTKPNSRLYSNFNNRDQESFTSDVRRKKEQAHLTDRRRQSPHFGPIRDEPYQNRIRSRDITPNSGTRDSSKSTSTTYDNILESSFQVDNGRQSSETKNLKSSRWSLGRIGGILAVLFVLAIGGALIYLFVIKKDRPEGHAECEPRVAFENAPYIFNIGFKATLACHFENIQDWPSIKIASNRGEDIAKNASELQILQNERCSTNSSGRIVAIFDPVQCTDSPEAAIGEFEYTCAIHTEGETLEAKTLVTFQSKPGTPLLTVSSENVENKSSLIDRLFTCEGELGYPAATLEVQSNFSGTFETLLSSTTGFMNNSLAWIVSDVPEKSECKNYRTIEFAFFNITSSMQLRCVMQLADGQTEAIYDEKTIHFQDIVCEDLTGTIGQISEVKCTFYNIEIDLFNLTESPVTVSVDKGGSDIFNSSRDSLNDSYSFVTSNEMEISIEPASVRLKFTPLLCQHVGEYAIKYLALHGSSRVNITAKISSPVISGPDKFYRNQSAEFTCIGDMGRPKGRLVLEVFKKDGYWHDVLDITRIESETENCTTVTTLTHSFYVNEDVNGQRYRCKSTGDRGEVFSPGIKEVIISEAVYFTETSVSRKIGSTFEFTCVLEANFSSSGAIISRSSGFGRAETLCNVSDTGPVTCGSERISGIPWLNENNLTTIVTIDSVYCEDEGLYFCGSVSHTIYQASMTLSVTNPPEGKPQLSLPARMVVDLKEFFNKIECRANVGYPAGDLQIQHSNDNFVTYKKLDIGNVDVATSGKEGCSVTKNITYREYRYTQSWNNTEIRCAVYYPQNDVTPFKVSDIRTITLIRNDCPPEGIWYLEHPFNCHYSITCSDGHITVVDHCGNKCPDVIDNRSAPLCTGDCSRC